MSAHNRLTFEGGYCLDACTLPEYSRGGAGPRTYSCTYYSIRSEGASEGGERATIQGRGVGWTFLPSCPKRPLSLRRSNFLNIWCRVRCSTVLRKYIHTPEYYNTLGTVLLPCQAAMAALGEHYCCYCDCCSFILWPVSPLQHSSAATLLTSSVYY